MRFTLIRTVVTAVRAPLMSRILPSLPSRSLDAFGLSLQDSLVPDLQDIFADQHKDEENRDVIFSVQKKISIANNQLLECVRNGDIDSFPTQLSDIRGMTQQLLETIRHDQCQRESRVSNLVEKTLVADMLFRFFTEGRVPSQQTFAYCMDDEYIGALTGFAQELSRYTTNRACENDILSIEISRRLVTQLNEALLSLDFRNGPLRRKYDSVKYAVKAIEGIAFEFSLSSDSTRTTVLFSESTLTDSKAGVESPSKRARMEINETSLDSYIDMADIKIIQQRMEAFDLCREQVIKDSRDVQKLSKQAIFAIQRLNLAEAEKKLGQAKESGRTLLKRIESYPTLRQGALSNALEEWAEAMLLFHWVSSKTIISRGALEIASIAEYIGGLSDFTGEIGRIAVLRAAHRDLCMVQEILQADMVVQNFIAKANVSANRYAKKLEAVQVNLKKVEDIVYELVLLQRSNRVSRVKADVSMPADKEDAKEE